MEYMLGTTEIDWGFAGQVSGYGFAGVFIAMCALALVIWLVGRCHAAFAEKLKGRGVLVGLLVALVLAALIAAHIISEKRRAVEISGPSAVNNRAAAEAPAGEDS